MQLNNKIHLLSHVLRMLEYINSVQGRFQDWLGWEFLASESLVDDKVGRKARAPRKYMYGCCGYTITYGEEKFFFSTILICIYSIYESVSIRRNLSNMSIQVTGTWTSLPFITLPTNKNIS